MRYQAKVNKTSNLVLSFCVFVLIFLLYSKNSYAVTYLNTIGNTVTAQSNIFRSNVNPTWNFQTDSTGGTITSIVFQMNSTSNSSFGYPASIASTVTMQILSGATVLGTYTYSSYDAGTKRVTLTGSVALSANTSYILKVGCVGCANVGFDQSSTNSTGWAFTSNYFGTGYPIVSLSGTAANSAPVLSAISNQSSERGVSTSLTVSATDSDGDTLTYSASGLPTGLSINTSTGVISGTPTVQGTYSVTVGVSDGQGGSDSKSFTWTITGHAPALSAISNQSSQVGVSTSLSVSAADSDGDTLTYSASGLPTGLSINTSTGVISGTPTVQGTYSVTVGVSDGQGGSDSKSFTWTITGHAPALSAISNQSSQVGVSTSLSVSAADSDGDTLTYSASGLPTGLSINTSTGVISGTPTVEGSYNVTVGVSDSHGSSDSKSFTWEITVVSVVTSPLSDVTLVNLIQAQNGSSTRIVRETINPIKNRLNSLLSMSPQSTANISTQGINLMMNFNPDVQKLLGLSGFKDHLNLSGLLLENGWGVWTAGEIVLGQGKNGADFKINSLTFGSDKRITPRLTSGMSIRVGGEHNNAGDAIKLNNNFYSITAYGSYHLNYESHLQATLGYSKIKIESERPNNNSLAKGDRDANQVYGSVDLTRKLFLNQLIDLNSYPITLLPYLALDGGYTRLNSYSEVGSSSPLSYGDQDVKTLTGSMGVRVNYSIHQSFGELRPKLQMNYQNELYSESKSVISYVSNPSVQYMKNYYHKSNSTIMSGLGLDYHYKNMFISGIYEHSRHIDWGKSNRYVLMGRLDI